MIFNKRTMRKITSVFYGGLLTCSVQAANGTPQKADSLPYLQNRAPLKEKPYLNLPFGAIKPAGWLMENLQKMKSGMTGQLDELYPSVLGKRNGWLGGDGDVWERGPYWLDGLAPLAFILDDEALQQKLQPWVEWSLANQMEDGYFGPIPPEKDPEPEPGLQRDRARDWWPKMVMLKVLQQYYTGTGDKRVIDLMLRYARYQLKTLPQTPLGHYSWWGAQRGADNLEVTYWLYNLTGEKFLLELAELMNKQVFDWKNTFLHTNHLATTYKFHGVNLAQGIKSPVIYYQQSQDHTLVASVKKAFADIRTYQGQAMGLYGADELTRGGDPILGSELCSAVEMMFSLENMMTITGDAEMMDHLERIAYNALPTQITDDFMARQYYQQPNQVMVTRHHRNFVTAYDGTDICFGLLTGFPCCTTNMHQGWPKFVQNLWHASHDKGAAALMYAPSEATVVVNGNVPVTFKEETEYPFREKVKFTLNMPRGALFPFHLRIPGWCKKALIRVNGSVFMEPDGGQVVKMHREWRNGDVVELEMPMKVATSRWYDQSLAVERGPLVYALKIEEQWKDVPATDRYGSYREVRPGSPWNFGISEAALKELDKSFKVEVKGMAGKNPWTLKQAPVEIRTRGKRIPEWKIYNETAGAVPYSPIRYLKETKEEEIVLVPYGCTTLRISQFPVVQ